MEGSGICIVWSSGGEEWVNYYREIKQYKSLTLMEVLGSCQGLSGKGKEHKTSVGIALCYTSTVGK